MAKKPPSKRAPKKTPAPIEARTPARTRKKLARAGAPQPSAGWWGDGPPPWDRWPGVTIKLECVWNPHYVGVSSLDAEVEVRGRWESPDGRFFFDLDAAQKAVDFFPEFLTHHIGEFSGQPFELLSYQEMLQTRPLFGWMRVSDGTRRFRKAFIFLPKGAGKSPWGAGTGLYLTLCDDEPSAEVYVVAGDKEQARVVHTNAKIMVEESQELDNMCEVLRDSIYDGASRSSMKVLSSDASTKHGFRPHGIIFDEFHAQPNRDLFEALEKSMVKRRQPLMLLITHAGDDDEGICYEEYELAKKILSGTSLNEVCLPVIFESTPEDNFEDPAVWKRVNPAHGVLVKHDAIAAAAIDAAAEPRKLNDFLRFHLNRWVGQAVAWIPVDWWDKCKSDLHDEFLRSLPVYAGLDMAQKNDLAAFVLVFPEPIDGPALELDVIGTDGDQAVTRKVTLNFRINVVPTFWLPEATLKERVKQDHVPYDVWRKQGLLRVTEGDVIDYNDIFKYISGPLCERFPRLRGAEIAYDPAFATDISLKLRDKGFTTVEVLQNFQHLSESCHILEAFIKGRRVSHDGHRLLRWNFENVAVKRDDAGRIRPVKPRKQAKRIDGVVGTLMGLSRAFLQPEMPTSEIIVLSDRARPVTADPSAPKVLGGAGENESTRGFDDETGLFEGEIEE